MCASSPVLDVYPNCSNKCPVTTEHRAIRQRALRAASALETTGRHLENRYSTKTFSFISTLFLRLLLAESRESRSSNVIGKKLAGTSRSQSQSHRPVVLLIAATHGSACAPAREASGGGCEKLVGVP